MLQIISDMVNAFTRKFHAPEVFVGKALQGAAVVNLRQAMDSDTNGCLRERPRGEFFSAFS
jgi:hypothetical protein